MSDDARRAFAALHVRGAPLVLFNAWDAGSARTIASAGARAIATGSWSVAAAFGYDDGECMPYPLVLENLARIVAAVALPVTLDFESGYADDTAELAAHAVEVAARGAVGINFEDGLAGKTLRAIPEQAARIAAIRAATPLFVNARTDAFLQAAATTHDAPMLEATLERARAYADAGADGLFVPGLVDEALIARACERSPLPVNIMMSPGAPPAARLAALGVARISHGPGPYRLAMRALAEAARAAHDAVGA